MNTAKQKQTHRYREQTRGYQQRKKEGETGTTGVGD